jgi:transcriptional regulator with XRE-family HTH domain
MQERFADKSGADLIAVRKRLGVTRKAIADRLNTTPTTLYRWETDRVQVTALMYARYEAAAEAVFASHLGGDAA